MTSFSYDSKLCSKNGNTFASKQDWKANTVFVDKWIDSTSKEIVRCKIKTVKDGNSCLYFGIVSSKGDQSFSKHLDETLDSYIYQSYGKIYINAKEKKDGLSKFNNPGDTITLTLDLTTKIIWYQINDSNQGVLAKKIKTGKNIKYKFAFTMHEIVNGNNGQQQVLIFCTSW